MELIVVAPVAFAVGVIAGLLLASRGYRIVRKPPASPEENVP
jgi:hypothetical protein